MTLDDAWAIAETVRRFTLEKDLSMGTSYATYRIPVLGRVGYVKLGVSWVGAVLADTRSLVVSNPYNFYGEYVVDARDGLYRITKAFGGLYAELVHTP